MATLPASQHAYAYALNNPTNFTDPSGRFVPGLAALALALGVSPEVLAFAIAGTAGTAAVVGAEAYIQAHRQDIADFANQCFASASTRFVQTANGSPEMYIQIGERVYCVFGDGSRRMGGSWSPVDPSAVPNYRDAAGLPNQNSGRFVVEGTVKKTEGSSSAMLSRSTAMLVGFRNTSCHARSRTTLKWTGSPVSTPRLIGGRAVADERTPDFYLASSDYPEFDEPRKCFRLKRIGGRAADDYLLVRVDPPIVGQPYGLGATDIEEVVLATRRAGESLFPVRQWPVFVHVARPLVPHPEQRKSLQTTEMEHLAWAELYESQQAAEAKDIRPRPA